MIEHVLTAFCSLNIAIQSIIWYCMPTGYGLYMITTITDPIQMIMLPFRYGLFTLWMGVVCGCIPGVLLFMLSGVFAGIYKIYTTAGMLLQGIRYGHIRTTKAELLPGEFNTIMETGNFPKNVSKELTTYLFGCWKVNAEMNLSVLRDTIKKDALARARALSRPKPEDPNVKMLKKMGITD